jgi:hypothetical protein
VSSRSRRSKMSSRLFTAAPSTFCSSPAQRPRGGRLVGLLRLLGSNSMRPEYRALLRGSSGASYMGLRPIPPHPVRPCGPDCSRTASGCQERARRPQ